MSDLADLRRDLSRLIDLEPVQHAIGLFGKETALNQAKRDLGGDMAFSGWKSKVRLGAGYDLGTPVVLNLRPAGMWFLAEDGRKRRGKIRPKKRGGKIAVSTPQGARYSSSYTRSRGFKSITKIERNIEKGIVKAAEKGVNDMITKGGF